jgi:hypothetical protein
MVCAKVAVVNGLRFSASKIPKRNGFCGCPGIAERQLGIREIRKIKNAELALGGPRKAFRATVCTSPPRKFLRWGTM